MELRRKNQIKLIKNEIKIWTEKGLFFSYGAKG